MGTGYVRNDTSNNIADGNIINAADLDGEFDAIESAFGTSGHTHDGTSAEGGPVTVLGPTQDFVASATEIKPKTTNTLDIGTSGLLFKDMYLDGVATLGSIKIDNGGAIGSASDADAIAISSSGVVTFSQAPLVDVTNATTNAVTDVLGIRVQSTGTPAVGIGSGLTLGVETASGNIETGGAIRIVSTGLTPTDEEIDLVFYSMRNGSLTEAFRFDSDTDSLRVEDNVKITFGAGQDLQIYHDGSASYIDDAGTGNLKIRASNMELLDASGNDYITMVDGGAGGTVRIKHLGITVLTTTSTGIDVTGTLVSDGLNVEIVDNDAGPVTIQQGGNSYFKIVTTNSSESVQLGNFTTNPDILLGGGNVGIGTTSPSAKLSVTGLAMNSASSGVELEGAWPWLKFKDTEANQDSWLQYIDGSNFILKQIDYDDRNSAPSTVGTERMRIDSSGNVGIGFSNPDAYITDNNSTVVKGQLRVQGVTNTAAVPVIGVRDDNTGFYLPATNTLGITTNGSEAMRIDSSGNVGIDFIPKTMTANVTSSLNVGSGTVFQRTKDTYLGSNMYYNASDVGKSISTGYGLAYYQDVTNGAHKWFTSAVSAGSADATHSFSTPMLIDSSGNVGIGTNGAPTFTAAYGGLHVHSTYPEIHLTGIDSGSGASDGFKIQKNSANHVYLWNYENAFMAFGTNNAERMRIEADGDIQFGTSTNYAWMRPYETTTGNLIISADNGGTGTNGSNILFRTRGANKMIIEHSTGNVGIGTSSPSKKLHISGDRDAILRFENTRTVESGDQILGSLEFYSNDESGTGANVRSRINALTSTGGNSSYLTFSTADGTTDDVEAMRIDSSGNLFVNQTSTGDYTTTVGSSFRSSGFSTHTADANAALLLNRLTSDGDILLFRKDNTTVGSIGTNGGDLTIGTGDTGIRFIDSLDCLLPLNTSTNATRDAAIDIGYNDGGRFKDLYLSGGVYLGGTGAANKLDDYEEGASFTITDQSGAALSLTVSNSGYTKIGQMVHAWYNVTYPITSNTSPARLSLPFTSAFSSSFTGGAVLETSYTGGAIMASVDASTYVRFRNNGLTPLLNSDLSAKNVRFTIHYIAA